MTVMRHATWTAIEASPVARRMYRAYRRLPDGIRGPIRWLTMPRWYIAVALVRLAARDTVVSGPFVGMRLDLSPVSSRHLLGYVLGTQEMELGRIVESAIARNHGRVINLGAADGYYAVGLARRLPQAEVVAFEALAALHPVLQRVARLNEVEGRILLRGLCRTADLENELRLAGGRGALVVADVEGCEVELLDPTRVPSLRRADILVETHDLFVPRCTEILVERFRATHRIERVVARPRTMADFPAGFLPLMTRVMPRTALELMHERRPDTQNWLWMEAERA